MEITEIKVHLKDSAKSKLKAFVTITFDNQFVIRDLKIIDGKKGLFVAMPSTKVTEPCPGCGRKNAIRSHFCSNCGGGLELWKEIEDKSDVEEHRDIAHPINTQMRDYIQTLVMKEFELELQRCAQGMHQPSADFDE